MVLNRRRWNAGRQHSCRVVPWKRSHTALWLGLRGGIRWWTTPNSARWSRNRRAMYSGTVIRQHCPYRPAEPAESTLNLGDEPAGVLGRDRAEHDLDERPPGGGVHRGELVHLADAFEVADVEAVHRDQIPWSGRPVAEPEQHLVGYRFGDHPVHQRGQRGGSSDSLRSAAQAVVDEQLLDGGFGHHIAAVGQPSPS